MNYQTIKVRFEEPICYLQFYRPEANNTINDLLIEECRQVLELCEKFTTIIVLEGLPEVFCFGADFQGIHNQIQNKQSTSNNPEPLYDLWLKLATGPYVTISYVRGKANAGGVGFVASSDIVLADETAQFSLSELLFGLFPACVLPFLVRRIGFQRAHYMTLMTQPIPVQQAFSWGLVDSYENSSDALLRKHLLRLKRLPKTGIMRYKNYMGVLKNELIQSKSSALAANKEIFSDPQNLDWIYRFVEKGLFPWQD
jgi:polyketide biosynthesis enoyl-CoA hydratase PksH